MTAANRRRASGRRPSRTGVPPAAVLRSAVAGMGMVGLLGGLPPALVAAAGNPIPGSVPTWQQLTTAAAQRDVRPEVVVDILAGALWIVWGQLALAVLWELLVQLPRLAVHGRRGTAPLLLRPLSGLVSRLVPSVIALWVSLTASDGAAALDPAPPSETWALDGPRWAISPAWPSSAAEPMTDRPTATPEPGWPAHHVPTAPVATVVRRAGAVPATTGRTEPVVVTIADSDADSRAHRLIWTGSALVIAAALGIAERRRRFSASHRVVGAVPVPPDPVLARLEHDLRRRVDLERVHWLTAAVRSLAAAGGPNLRASTPLWLETADDRLVARYGEPGPELVPEPWSLGAGGESWWLPTSTPVWRLAGGGVSDPFPTMVTVADELMVNLAAAGGVAVIGDRRSTEAVVRSIVYELAYSPLTGDVRVMASPGVCPGDAEHLVTLIAGPEAMFEPPADAPIAPDAERITVWLLDASQADLRPSSMAGCGPDQAPMILVGAHGPAGWDGLTLRLTDRGVVVDPPRLPIGRRGEAPPVLMPPAQSPADPSWAGVSPAGLSAEMATEITSLLADRRPGRDDRAVSPAGAGPMLRLLGRIALENIGWDLTSQQLSLIAYLACVGSARREAIVEALWDGRPISRSRFLNLMAELRSTIGREHLPDASDGRYTLVGVATDLGRFEASLGTAAATPERSDQILLEAMHLVHGIPLTAPGERYWAWVSDSGATAMRIEAMIADTGYGLAKRFREAGDPASAEVACRQGLVACPLDENLVTILAEIHLDRGRVDSARRLIDGWESKIRRLGCGEPSGGPRSRLATARP